jgi:hypothetical protein
MNLTLKFFLHLGAYMLPNKLSRVGAAATYSCAAATYNGAAATYSCAAATYMMD